MKLTKYWVIEMADAKDLSISVASMCVVLICNVMLVTTNFGATFAVVEQEDASLVTNFDKVLPVSHGTLWYVAVAG